MASFTDKSVQFNPYVQQLPVDAMVQVGTAKQQQYDQGIQRIQGQIDNIAGLDVVRDIDKEYLQSKIDSLGQNLTTVAAGDFSNYQLVNSVGGMVKQIGRDKNILNSVASTRNYRRGVDNMEKAIKDGKDAPSNNWYFQSKAMEWLNGDKVGGVFNDNYFAYTNYKKNAIEVIKSLIKSENVSDSSFDIGADGKIKIYDSTIRKKLAGIPPEQIQQALMAGLTPADMRQMEIDGMYAYSNVDPKTFAKNVTQGYQESFNNFRSLKDELKASLNSTTDATQKELIRKKMEEVDKQLRQVENEYKGVADTFAAGDYDSAKATLYSKNFINNFSRAFSFTEASVTHEKNEYADIELQRQRLDQAWKIHMMNYGLKEGELALKVQEYEDEATRKGQFGPMLSGSYEGESERVDMGKMLGYTTSITEGLSKSDAEQKAHYEVDEAGFNKMYTDWTKGKKVDPDLADYFQSTSDTRKTISLNNRIIEDVNRQMDAKYGTLETLIPEDVIDSISHVSDEGLRYDYTPSEIVNFNSRIQNYQTQATIQSSGGTSIQDVPDYEKAKAELSPKEYELFKVWASLETDRSGSASQLEQFRDELFQTVNETHRGTIRERRKEEEDLISEKLMGVQAQRFSINLDDDNIQGFQNMVGEIIATAEATKGGWPDSPDFDISVARKLWTDPNLIAQMRMVPSGSEFQKPIYEVTIAGKEGESTSFRLTPEQKAHTMASMFEPDADTRQMAKYEQVMNAFNTNTTSLDGAKTNPNNAYLDKTDFPQVRNYGVTGNIQRTATGGYTVRLNIYDPVTGTMHEDIPYSGIGRSFAKHMVVPAINRELTDDVIYELLHNKAPQGSDMKEVEKHSRNPLR